MGKVNVNYVKRGRERQVGDFRPPMSRKANGVTLRTEAEKVIYKKMRQLLKQGGTLDEATQVLKESLPDQLKAITRTQIWMASRFTTGGVRL